MNLNILSCTNGYIVTKFNYDVNGQPYKSYPSLNNIPSQHGQEQFIFSNLEELLNWVKTNAVLEKLK